MQPFEPSECVSSVQARGARVSAEQAELGHAWRQTTRDAPTLDHCLTRSRGQPEQFRRHQSEAGLGRSQSACNHLSPAAHSQRGVRQKACASNEAQECGASRARGAWPRMTLPRSTTRSMMAWAYHASDTVCRRLPHITWERWRGGGGGQLSTMGQRVDGQATGASRSDWSRSARAMAMSRDPARAAHRSPGTEPSSLESSSGIVDRPQNTL
jgi:hypothetical protein